MKLPEPKYVDCADTRLYVEQLPNKQWWVIAVMRNGAKKPMVQAQRYQHQAIAFAEYLDKCRLGIYDPKPNVEG